jgi:beta-catenin-like protein 1
MVLMLQSRKQSRFGALKCLDYAATRYVPPGAAHVLGGVVRSRGLVTWWSAGQAKVAAGRAA